VVAGAFGGFATLLGAVSWTAPGEWGGAGAHGRFSFSERGSYTVEDAWPTWRRGHTEIPSVTCADFAAGDVAVPFDSADSQFVA
jgi:hypothetical protein